MSSERRLTRLTGVLVRAAPAAALCRIAGGEAQLSDELQAVNPLQKPVLRRSRAP